MRIKILIMLSILFSSLASFAEYKDPISKKEIKDRNYALIHDFFLNSMLSDVQDNYYVSQWFDFIPIKQKVKYKKVTTNYKWSDYNARLVFDYSSGEINKITMKQFTLDTTTSVFEFNYLKGRLESIEATNGPSIVFKFNYGEKGVLQNILHYNLISEDTICHVFQYSKKYPNARIVDIYLLDSGPEHFKKDPYEPRGAISTINIRKGTRPKEKNVYRIISLDFYGNKFYTKYKGDEISMWYIREEKVNGKSRPENPIKWEYSNYDQNGAWLDRTFNDNSFNRVIEYDK